MVANLKVEMLAPASTHLRLISTPTQGLQDPQTGDPSSYIDLLVPYSQEEIESRLALTKNR
jgi:hypothetical protein